MQKLGGGLSRRLRGALRWRLQYLKTHLQPAARRLRTTFVRVSPQQLDRALSSLSRQPAGIVFVHSSLSAFGYFEGGVEAVLQSLLSWTKGGSLVLPTHTYCYPGPGGTPIFDPKNTPSRVGVISDRFWRRAGVLRSLHPSHSVACWGADAARLCAGHEDAGTPCGQGTPYALMIEERCSVLMLGARMDAYTLFHTSEDAAAAPYLYEPEIYHLRLALDSGERVVRTRRQDASIARRFIDMDDWLEARGLLERRSLGAGRLLFIPDARAVHECIVEQIRSNPWFLTQRGQHQDEGTPLPPERLA
jgi:aminoglycoside 3-N-acetyltransferase